MTAVTLAGLTLSEPVLAASGCAGSGAELARFTSLADFGAVITRSITLEPRAGGPLPRLVESPAGLVNSLGLPGPGVEEFVASELPALARAGATVFVSVWGETASDYAKVAQRLRQCGEVAAVEVNVSHPSVSASDAAAAVHQVRRNTATDVPVFAKLGIENTVAVARSCVGAGADGLSLVNAVPAVAISAPDARPALGSVVGALSGPAIRPLALRAVWQVRDAMPEIAIIGSGGVVDGRDALEFLLAGADVVAIGTALLNDPSAGRRISRELADLLSDRGVGAVRGAAHPTRGEPT